MLELGRTGLRVWERRMRARAGPRGRWMKLASLLCALSIVLACTSKQERLSAYEQRAATYYEQEQWPEAKIEFLNLLQLDPDNASAHYKMAETLWRLKEHREAVWQYKEAARLDPDNTNYGMRVAQVSFLARDYDAAMKQLNALLEQEPDYVDVLIMRGRVARIQGKPERQLADLERALELDPENAAALSLQAQALAEGGDVEGAEASLKKLVEYEPAVSSHLLYGIFLSRQGREDDALLEYQAAVGSARDVEERTQARLILSNFYLNRRDYVAAEKELLEAREEVPDNASLLLTLAQFYALRGEEARAEEMLEKRVAKLPDDPLPLLVLADFHRRLGKPEQALETVDRALALDPKSEPARLRKAEYLLGVAGGEPSPERKAAAKRLVEEVLAENPNSLQGLFTEGKFLIVEGRNEEAATRLRRVIEEQPDANAHVLLGTAYVRMGQTELARGEFLQALQLDAGNQVARTQLAALYLRIGERALADQQAQTALERQPGNASLLLIRAEALTGLQRKQEALEVLQTIPLNESSMLPLQLVVAGLFRRNGELDQARVVLEAIPGYEDNPAVIAELIQIEEQRGTLQQAITLLNQAIERNPDEPRLYELRGRVYSRMRANGSLAHAKEAERDLKASLEKDPTRVESYVLLSNLYQLTNRPEEAVASYQRALEVNPTAEVYIRLGAQYEAMRRLKLARENYEAALRLDPEQPLAQNNLAWLLADAENPSAEQLDRALELAQDAKEKLPRDPNVADTLGWVMFKKNLPAAAVSLFQEAIHGYSDNAELRAVARYHLAQTYERTGERERAIAELKLALEEAPSFPERGGAEALLERLSSV